MKLKLSFIAGALALGFAAQANAQITTGAGLGDQVFLSVWDPVVQVSYTRGLSMTDQSLVNGFGINFGTATNGSGFTATGGTGAQNYTLAADANLTSFLSVYAADAASMQWNVVGGEPNTYGNSALVATVNGAMSTGWSTSFLTGQLFPTAYIANGVNNMMSGTAAGSTDSVIATAASNGSAYANAPTASFGDQLGNSVPFHTAGNIGSSLNFYLLSPTTNARGQYAGAVGLYQFASTTGTAATWTLGSNGALTYSVAPVPEPGEWALMLSGLALVGFIATRRRKLSDGMMSFA